MENRSNSYLLKLLSMKSQTRNGAFFLFRGLDYALYPTFLLRVLFLAITFSLLAWIIGKSYPLEGVSLAWLYGFGVVTWIALVISGEFVTRFRLRLMFSKDRWYRLLWDQMAMPLLFSLFAFSMIAFPLPDFFSVEQPAEMVLQRVAKFWAWVYFPAFLLYAMALHVLVSATVREQMEAEKRAEFNMASMALAAKLEMATMRQLLESPELLGSPVREQMLAAWKEDIAKYLNTPPKQFKRPVHNLYCAVMFNTLIVNAYETMFAYVNFLLKGARVEVAEESVSTDEVRLVLKYKDRSVMVDKPIDTGNLDKVVIQLAALLLPDYELRHCRLMAEKHHFEQFICCLEPHQWEELEQQYGRKKMAQYFAPVDKRFKTVLQLPPKRKSKWGVYFDLAERYGKFT